MTLEKWSLKWWLVRPFLGRPDGKVVMAPETMEEIGECLNCGAVVSGHIHTCERFALGAKVFQDQPLNSVTRRQ